MDRFYIYSGALRLLGMLCMLGMTACQDDFVVVPVLEEGERACARPLSHGHWEDGTHRTVGTARHVCLCMTEAEYESESRFDELNQALRRDCEQDAVQYGFDWTDCEEDFAAKNWIGDEGQYITWPTGPVRNPPGSTVECR